jgi:predicted outer membrane protein
MKKLFNLFLVFVTACAFSACSGTKETTSSTTVETNPVAATDASNPNTQTSPTGLTSAGSQISVDTAKAMFPVNEKGELSTESFIQLAALAGTKEIELGKQLAGSKNISITLKSDTLRPEQDYKLAAKQLNLLSTDKFDRAYLTAMLDDHKRAVALFQLGSASKDAEVKAYAEKYLPKLRDHLAQVEKLIK